MNALRMALCFSGAAVPVAVDAQVALGVDVQLQAVAGKVVTGAAFIDEPVGLATEIRIGQRVFADAVQSTFRGSNPGFNVSPSGDPLLPAGVEGFGGRVDLRFDIVPFRVDGVVSNFFFWNGADPAAIAFATPPASVSWNLFDEDFQLFQARGENTVVPGGLIDTTTSSGRLHNHLPLAIDDGDGVLSTTAAQGVYLAALTASAPGFEASDPFFIALRTPDVSAATLSAAAAWIDANYDSLVDLSLAGDFNEDGRVDAADYTVWRDTGLSAADLAEWRTNYGASRAGAAVAAVATSVPEPGAGSVAALAAALVAGRGGRGSSATRRV